MKRLLFIFLLSYPIVLSAQRAMPVLPEGADINQIDHGPHVNNSLGSFDLEEVDGDLWLATRWTSYQGIYSSLWVWDGVDYAPLDCPFTTDTESTSRVYKIIEEQDVIYLIGRFNGSGEVLQRLNGDWIDLDANTDDRLLDAVLFNGELFVVGRFDVFNGVEGNYVYKYDGEAWVPVGDQLIDDSVEHIEVFQDELYITMSFGAESQVMKLVEEEWVPIGTGLSDGVEGLEVYNGNLVVCGQFMSNGDGTTELNGTAIVTDDGFQPFLGDTGLAPNWGRMIQVGDQLILSSHEESEGSIIVSGESIEDFMPMSIQSAQIFEGRLFFSGYHQSETDLGYRSTLYVHDPHRAATLRLDNGVLSPYLSFQSAHFQKFWSLAGYETLVNNGLAFENPVSTIFSSGLWYGGLNEDELFLCASKFINIDGEDDIKVSYGPISDSYDVEYLERYFGIWSVTQEEIEYHIQHVNDNGYQPLGAIMSYPGNGRVEFGESEHLLPFVDVDSDGWYEPMDGDYPLIRGDQSVFLIHSDQRFGNADEKAGIELITEFYSFDSEDPNVAYTTFVNTEFRNMSGRDYEDFTIGIFNDHDIGTPVDDFVGTSPEGNYVYGYNGDPNDEPSTSSPGYGNEVPAQATAFLSQDLHKSLYYNNGGNPINGDPSTALDYFQYLNGIWKNGQQLLFGGDGAYEVSGADPDNPTDFMFPDFPWEAESDDWNEITAGNPPADRRILGSIAPFDFANGETFCLDYAYVTAFPETDEQWNEIMVLDERVDAVNQFFDAQNFNCEWLQNPLNVESAEITVMEVSLYPNPTSGQLTIASAEAVNSSFIMYDLSGRVVLQGQLQNGRATFDASAYEQGVYLVRVDGRSNAQRVIISKSQP
ncbi:T9SS type A sorting domain-containing protein [Sanyastnella coralliicola]|uniref:T9SS type A sorting domain-containing protein n=1 Tax=Sanyastnella coralliicola TaxID=3069118 RepID=UPI0027B92CEF|nr:T9SS type A sorting domain-containing protein [Longitalea sp. SCSIO 12813]